MAPLSKLVQYSQLLSILLLLVATVIPQHVAAAAHELQGRPRQGMMGRPGCRDKCGGMSIPFPFGMDKPGCFLPGFEVTCNTSFTPPRAFLAYNHNDPPYQAIYRCKFGTDTSGCKYTYQPVELFGISLETNEVRVYGGVTSRCFTSEAAGLTKGQYMELDRAGPFLLSPRDDLVGVGWNVKSSMSYQIKPYPDPLSCTSNDPFRVTAPTGSCSGLGCCRVALPPPWPTMPVIETAVILEEAVAGDNTFWKYNPCSYGMVVEGSWYNFTAEDMAGYEVLSKKLTRGFPLVLDFAIRNGSCQRDSCPSGNSSCANAAYDSEGYVCKCKEHYHGNPYIANGCQAVKVHMAGKA
ncbi:wall-associated receptor kinase 1 isoform X3 [Lolium perenne]|uniref:wall-associated receptor kinase 1 isoform X3 n=1 Tax=Lolium perenne TaxID=4522 RepID=UPI0021F68280|nr:wall-associated receptor kinase 1-like isoform X3 [Lolium perenne]